MLQPPLTLSARKVLLSELLKLQERIGKRIISDEELVEIERIWKKDTLMRCQE